MKREPIISLILAMADNGVIGDKNSLPWHLPNDLRFFKQNTIGKPVIMGRKTYESIGRPLPQRDNVVISRTPRTLPNTQWFTSLEEAIANFPYAEEIMIMGGAEIYRQALPLMDRLYLTHVHADVEGDTRMEPFDFSDAELIFEEKHQKDNKNPYNYTFEIWDFKQNIFDE